jgi:hypothetical protein
MAFAAPNYERIPDHSPHQSRRKGRMRLIAWVTALALLAASVVPALVFARGLLDARTPDQPAATGTLPADLFIQSVVKDDGALGWRQLCPAVQAQLPQSELQQQADAQRQATAQQGVRLTSTFVGTQPRSAGGEIRAYVLTAHWANGATQQRSYTVLTQASGCVEDVTTG